MEVYAQLSKPDGVREGAMPYTAWKCMTQSRGSPTGMHLPSLLNFILRSLIFLIFEFVTENMPAEAAERVSLLAIAWDRKVQVAKLVKSELKVYGKWSVDSPVLGLAWLDDQVHFIFLFICLVFYVNNIIQATYFGSVILCLVNNCVFSVRSI